MKKVKYIVALCAVFAGSVALFQQNILTSFARERAKALQPISSETYRVERVFNAKSFQLENGKIVRLMSLQVPNVQETKGLMRAGEPHGEDAKAYLKSLIEGKKLRLRFAADKEDRKGRWLAQAYLTSLLPDDDTDVPSVQEMLLKAGWAVTYPFTDNQVDLRKWQQLENVAREEKRGIWKDQYWQAFDANTIATPKRERFGLVEGVVQNVATVKGTTYVNFGDDWKTDFTAVIGKYDKKRFKKMKPASLKGKRIRVRGWIYEKNGASIDLHQPEQIEIL